LNDSLLVGYDELIEKINAPLLEASIIKKEFFHENRF